MHAYTLVFIQTKLIKIENIYPRYQNLILKSISYVLGKQ